MRRRSLLRSALVGVALTPLLARAQQKPMPVVGFLALAAPAPFAPFLAAFHDGLREAGYVEGRNVVLEYRWAEGRVDRLPELAADLVARKVDVIVAAGGLLAARIAKEATSSIPVIFDTGTDPVAAGLVTSMARPEGNLTGLAILTSDLNPKRLELLMEMVPTAAAVAFLVNPTNATNERVISE